MATRRLGTLNFIKQHLDTSVPHMTLEYLSSCVYLSYLMSTIFHREMLDESRWREIGRVLLRDCLNSIMLFIPSLIPGQDLLFAETLSRDTLCRHFPANIVDSCGSMAPPAQATLMSTSQVPADDGDSPTALLELDTSFIEALRCLTSLTLSPLAPGAALVTPIILDSDMTFPRLSNGVSRVQSNLTHWNAAKNLFGSFPLDSERLVTLFVDLLMHEYLKSRTSNSWDKYLLSGKTTTDLYTLGPRVFKDGNYIRIFAESSVKLSDLSTFTFFKNLIPSPSLIRSNMNAAKGKPPYQTLQVRSFYVRLVNEHPDIDFDSLYDNFPSLEITK